MENLIHPHIMVVASLTGSVAFALSGYLAGARKNLDWMGLFILAFLTANGGGVLRDVLADRPPAIITSNEPFLIALAVTTGGLLLRLHRYDNFERRWLFIICDAIGLVAFALTGSIIALSLDAPLFGFLGLAFLTATGGAILRDVLVNEIPAVLHRGFYGSIALIVALLLYLLDLAGLLSPESFLAVFAFGLTLRLLAYKYSWNLPRP
jgi:uncharacterized membrane protein YeiH